MFGYWTCRTNKRPAADVSHTCGRDTEKEASVSRGKGKGMCRKGRTGVPRVGVCVSENREV